MTRLSCEWCGKAFYRKPSKISKRNFCSIACSRSAPWPPDDRRFQSHFVSQETRRKIGLSNSKKWGTRECVICGKIFRLNRYITQRKTCGDTSCAGKLRSISLKEEGHPRWKGGTNSHWTRKAQRVLEKEGRARQCEQCKANEQKAIGGIAIHHKDKDRTHNAPQNLTYLCGSCHSKLHHPSGLGKAMAATM